MLSEELVGLLNGGAEEVFSNVSVRVNLLKDADILKKN